MRRRPGLRHWLLDDLVGQWVLSALLTVVIVSAVIAAMALLGD